MKIAIVNNCVPFIRGGAEHLADALYHNLLKANHQVELIKIPFRWYPPEEIIAHAVACLNMQIYDADLVIGLKFPAYLIPAKNKVMWLLHQFRQVYDLWGTPYQDLPNSDEGIAIRNTIHELDNQHFSTVKKIFTNSEVTSNRLKEFNGFPSEVLLPPLLNPDLFRAGPTGDYIFCPSRVNNGKRQYLLVEAMAHVKTNVRLIIAGLPETEHDQIKIESLIQEHQLQNRVTFIPRFISEEEKADWMEKALACAYIPYNEDSYGYVTLEAYESQKAVITTNDSGGILNLVAINETGIVTAPDAKELASAFDLLYQDKNYAARLGRNGKDKVYSLGINWTNVVEKLTS